MRPVKVCSLLGNETFPAIRLIFEACGIAVQPEHARFEHADIVVTENPEDLRLQKPDDKKLFLLIKSDSEPHRTDFPEQVFACTMDQDETGITSFGPWVKSHMTSVLD